MKQIYNTKLGGASAQCIQIPDCASHLYSSAAKLPNSICNESDKSVKSVVKQFVSIRSEAAKFRPENIRKIREICS